MNGNGDLIKEIKSLRRIKTVCADSIDGLKADIPGHFKEIYRNLYNYVDDAEEVMEIRHEVEINIKEASLDDVDRVTSKEIRKAAFLLKPGKGDPAFSFSLDLLKINSDILLEYISKMIKSFLILAHVPQFMLLATLVPIIKDKLASVNISKNYRSACINISHLEACRLGDNQSVWKRPWLPQTPVCLKEWHFLCHVYLGSCRDT